jgi:murein DD-endopeptidase MepM/ murein hydrolase activator NlpD
VTLLPQWFTPINPADPSDPVIQVEVGFQPQSQAALHVWTLDSVQPAPGATITLGSSDSLTFTAQFNLAKNFSFAPISPAVGTISSHFGPRDPSIGAGPLHQGIDFALNVGSAVRAILDGTITDSGCQTGGCDVGYGRRVSMPPTAPTAGWSQSTAIWTLLFMTRPCGFLLPSRVDRC